MSLLKRALLVIWIPPVCGMFLMSPFILFFAIWSNGIAALSLGIAASFASCLVPSLTWWALMEWVWHRLNSNPRRRVVVLVAGGFFGILLASILGELVHTSGQRASRAIDFVTIGLLCGVGLSILVFPQSRSPGRSSRTALGKACIIAAAVFGSSGILVAGLVTIRSFASRLPSDDYARGQFLKHREDYLRFASLIENDSGVQRIDANGYVNAGGLGRGRRVPEYGELLKRIGGSSVQVREDGAIDFQLWGSGGAIMSDSYKGIRFSGAGSGRAGRPGWSPITEASLDDDKLPKENGRVATGYYILPIEANWAVYRFEYQE